VHDEPKCRSFFSLQFFQRGNYRHNLLRTRVGFAPIGKETIAEIFVNYAALFFDYLFATKNPRSEEKVQILTSRLPAERCKPSKVCDKKLTENIFDLPGCLLHDVRLILL
jgi:hypothetical protein